MSQAGDMTEILLTGTSHPYLNQTKRLHSSNVGCTFCKVLFIILVFLKNLTAADYAILALKILVFDLRSNIPSWSSIFQLCPDGATVFWVSTRVKIMRAMD